MKPPQDLKQELVSKIVNQKNMSTTTAQETPARDTEMHIIDVPLESEKSDEFNDSATRDENNTNEEQETKREGSCALGGESIKKILVGIILLGVIVFVIVDSLTTGYVRTGFEVFLKWIENNPTAGVFAFMGVYFAATVLFLPGSILTLGSGFVFANAFGLGFGVVLASVAVFFGASTGAIAAFIIGRYLLRDWVQTLTKKYPVFEAIDKALGEKGFRIMALLRLSPIIPFNVLNYIAGTTAVSLVHYTLSMLAILPGTILYVFLGATAGSLTDSATSGGTNTTQIVTIVVGVAFGVLGVGFTTYYAKQELRKITEARELEDSQEGMDEESTSDKAKHPDSADLQNSATLTDLSAGDETAQNIENNV